MARWEGMASAVAIVISLGAAAFSGLQWSETREHDFLSLKPHVDFDVEDDPDEPIVGIGVVNAGPGPAMVKAINFYVDRKPVTDAEDMAATYAKLSTAERDWKIMENGDTLGVGETVWLINYRKPRGGSINQKNRAAFADFVTKSAGIEITYCSEIRESECWTKCSAKGRCR